MKYSEKTCPSATLSTLNLTLPDLGLNPGRDSEIFEKYLNGRAQLICLESAEMLWVHGAISSVTTSTAI
jgi:hypothetical protein